MKRYVVRLNDNEHEVHVLERHGNTLTFQCGKQTHRVQIEPILEVMSPSEGGAPVVPSAPPKPSTQAATNAKEIRAEMPGLVVEVLKRPGDEVAAGEAVLIIEAMKMENNLCSSIAGTIKAIHVEKGEELDNDQLLVEIE